MQYIRQFWAVLMTPSDYRNDPYAEATNQISHAVLGCLASLILCTVWFIIFGEMPYRAFVWIVVVLGYAVGVEAWQQRWKGWDSFADTFFVQCGATMTLWPVKEVGFSPDIAIIEFRPKLLGVLMLLSALALALHLWPRIKRYFNARTLG